VSLKYRADHGQAGPRQVSQSIPKRAPAHLGRLGAAATADPRSRRQGTTPASGQPVLGHQLTGDPGNDLDYYIYELARLQDMGKSIIKVFGQPQELVDAQAEFDVGIPNLRAIRNPLTHPNDNDELDEVAWFSSAVKLKPGGSVEELVDPRYEQHEVATAYHLGIGSK